MKITPTALTTVMALQPHLYEDERGLFAKPFSSALFQQHGLDPVCQESFYSTSKQQVLRGMHFQTPPHHMAKAVFILQGQILDVVLDLRKEAPTYGKTTQITLDETKKNGIYIPKGFAHGFLTLSKTATVLYYQSKAFDSQTDTGIKFDPFGFNWPTDNPILSQRDESHPHFATFNTPF